MSACSSFPELREFSLSSGNFPWARIVSIQAASCRLEEAVFTPKIASLGALQWLNGPIDTKSAQSLTGSFVQCSEAWICTNTLSSSYSSNRCTLICAMKGNQPLKISRGHQIISIILIPWHGTNLFLSDRSFWSAYNDQESLIGPTVHLVYAPCYGGNAWQDTIFSCKVY